MENLALLRFKNCLSLKLSVHIPGSIGERTLGEQREKVGTGGESCLGQVFLTYYYSILAYDFKKVN